jgi:uncharacterized protein (UPF0248 family)
MRRPASVLLCFAKHRRADFWNWDDKWDGGVLTTRWRCTNYKIRTSIDKICRIGVLNVDSISHAYMHSNTFFSKHRIVSILKYGHAVIWIKCSLTLCILNFLLSLRLHAERTKTRQMRLKVDTVTVNWISLTFKHCNVQRRKSHIYTISLSFSDITIRSTWQCMALLPTCEHLQVDLLGLRGEEEGYGR